MNTTSKRPKTPTNTQKSDKQLLKRKNDVGNPSKVNSLRKLTSEKSPMKTRKPNEANSPNNFQQLSPSYGNPSSPSRQQPSPLFKNHEETNYISLQSMREILNAHSAQDKPEKLKSILKPAQPGSENSRHMSPDKTAAPSSSQGKRQNLSINLSSVDASNGHPLSPNLKNREETDVYVREMKHIENMNKLTARKRPKSGRQNRPNSATPTSVVQPTPAPQPQQPNKSVSATVAKTVQAHNETRKSIFTMDEEEEPSYAETEHQKYLMLKEMKEQQAQMSPRSATKFQEEYELSQVDDAEIEKGFELDEYGNIIFKHSGSDKKPEALCQEPLKLQYDPSQIQMTPVTNGTIGNNTTINTMYATNSTAVTMSSLKDFMHMARACNRAGKNRMEGLTHYKLGCKYEELNDARRAIKHYKRFFAIAQELGDGVGSSLALNCLGVCYHRRKGMENLKVALDYHIKHWEMADVQGKIVAHINMGLVYQKLGQIEQATENYKQAFQSAVDLGDKHGESIALANLGFLGKEQDDLTTAQACIERHLLIAESMKDGRSASDAYQQLGLLANKQGESEQALRMLTKAREVALYNTDHIKANQLRCNIGIVSASLKLDRYMKDIANKICTSIKDDSSAVH
jgi:tetratricopeptide (TPR) repeat protein